MTLPNPLIVATRESRLALWQAQHVQTLLQQQLGGSVKILGLTTRGDQILDRSLSKVGGKGLFVKELEAALEQGQAHLAVHSLKDVPMQLPPGFHLAAVLEREDARDAWVSPHFADVAALPAGACIGTSSLRRSVQLQALRPDVHIEPLRGNLDTRLRKLDEGQFDAIVLAAAGLIRLGLAKRIRSYFEPSDLLPCAGQGALGLEVFTVKSNLPAAWWSLLQHLNHTPSALAVHAERAVSRTLGGSCSMPLAAHAVWDPVKPGLLQLSTVLGHRIDVRQPLLRACASAVVETDTQAVALGEHVAALLQIQGATTYLS
jgi:hydroxymethylbilane synthase